MLISPNVWPRAAAHEDIPSCAADSALPKHKSEGLPVGYRQGSSVEN